MNTLEYFMELEKSTGIQGMGDRYEASAVMNDLDFKLYEYGTNVLVATGKAGGINFHSNERVKTPVFCAYAVA